MIEIKEVITHRSLNAFIRFPDSLYKNNPYRVPPLHSSEKKTLNKKENPSFDYCEAKYWLAYKDGKIVGRIAGIINKKSNNLFNENFARFSWFDFIDDSDVSMKLIQTVEEWAKSYNISHLHGPIGFTDLDYHGMLVDGFDEIVTQAVYYNYPYYPTHIAQLGYEKEVDWIQYKIEVPQEVPEKIIRIADLVKQKYNLRVLKAKKAKDIKPYAGKMFDALNKSYANLFGFVPLSEKEKAAYTKQYISFIDPKFVCFILDNKNEVIGFAVSLLSLSKALIKAKGKLFPLGFFYLLNALRNNDTVDMLLQGVMPEYHNKGIPAVFFAELMQAYINNGVKIAVSSQALEKNVSAFLMFHDYMHQRHLRSRCYVKKIC